MPSPRDQGDVVLAAKGRNAVERWSLWGMAPNLSDFDLVEEGR